MEIDISSGVFNVVESFIILNLFVFLNNLNGFLRKNILKSIIFIFLYTLIISFTDNIIPEGIKPAVNLLFLTLLLCFLTRTSLYASIIASAMIFIFFFIVEIMVMTVLMLVFKTDMEVLLDNLSVRILGGTISKLLQLLVVFIFVRSKVEVRLLSAFRQPNALVQTVVLQTLMIVFLIMSLSFVTSYKNNTFIYNIFIAAIYLLFLALNLIELKEREQLKVIQNRLKAQEEYIINMENIISIIRREKHDFTNHLNTILAMCTLNKADTVQKIASYIRKLSGTLVNVYHFFNSGNDYVDGMLAVKSNFAFEHGIKFEADFKVPLKDLSISDCDITSIIGNIIDNAFDAVLMSDRDEAGRVSISTYEDGLFYNLSISNNGPAIADKDIGRIFSSGFSTKDNDKSGHGFGLYIVQQMAHRYNGSITVSSTKEKTEFLVSFFKGVEVQEQIV